MRSTHFGTLCGLTTVLLCITTSSTLAEEDRVSIPPRNGGSVVALTYTSGVDRSPMQTVTGKIGDRVNAILGRGYLKAFDIDSDDSATISKGIETFLQDAAGKKRNFRGGSDIPDDLRIKIESLRKYLLDLLDRGYGSTEEYKLIEEILCMISKKLKNDPNRESYLTEVLRFEAVLHYVAYKAIIMQKRLAQYIISAEHQGSVVRGRYYGTTNFIYSSVPLRSSFSAQSLMGSWNGTGFAFDYDLVGYAPYPLTTLNTLRILKEPLRKDFERTANRLINREEEGVRLQRYVMNPHASLSMSYRRIDDIGEIFSGGLTTSMLLPLNRTSLHSLPEQHKSDALFLSFGWNHLWYEADAMSGYRTIKGVGFSAVASWQDASPFLYIKNGKETAELARWRWRAGVEYAQRNALSPGDYVALFARWRDHNPRTSPEEANTASAVNRYDSGKAEMGVQLGLLNGYLFVGGSIGYYFK